MDSEEANKPEEESPEVLSPAGARPLSGGSPAESFVRLSGYSGPPWMAPDVLKDLSPEQRYELVNSGLQAAAKNRDNQFQITRRKLDADTEIHKRNQWFGLAVFGLVVAVCFTLSWLFLTFGAKELITPVLTGLGGLGAGFAGGYGLGKRSSGDS